MSDEAAASRQGPLTSSAQGPQVRVVQLLTCAWHVLQTPAATVGIC